MKIGDRVFITDQKHPWCGQAGTVVAVNERYGLPGWEAHRVALDGNAGQTYVTDEQVMSRQPRVDSIRYTSRQVRLPRRK